MQAEPIHHQIISGSTALVLNDVTRAFVEAGGALEVKAAAAILPRLANLARACRTAGGLVVYCGYVHSRSAADMAKFWPSLQDGVLDAGARGSEIVDSLKPEPGDLLIEKKTYSPFTDTPLEDRLAARGIKTVVIGGVATNYSCYTTAREAQGRGFEVVFLSDGTATFDLSDSRFGTFDADTLQRASLATIAFGCAEVTTVEDVISRL